MAGKPLNLDWSQILPAEEAAAPPLELEVVPTTVNPSSTSAQDSSSFSIEHLLSDVELEEKILRMTKSLESGMANKLADKGQKFQANLRACQMELDRRKANQTQKACLSQTQRNTAEKCETATDSKATEPSVSASKSRAIAPSECNSGSSFFSLFNQALEKRAGSLYRSKISSGNSCQIDTGTNLCHISSEATKASLRRATFPPKDKVSSTEKKKSSNENCKSIKTSSFYAPCTGRRGSKRLKPSDGKNTLSLKRQKTQDVVLLDEEDLQPKDLDRYASDDRKETKIYYPSRDHPEAVELSFSDLKCLESEQYISSPIMNFYIRYLQRSLSSVNKTKGQYYFFNTYFFGKLEDAFSSTGDRFSKLRRWWKGVDLFEKAYIFLPIHKDLHWSLVIISISVKEDEIRPIILHLDSLGLHISLLIFDVVRRFLTEEWRYVKQNTSSPHVHTGEMISNDLPLKIDKKEIKVPQQTNEYDCGVFVLYFMERFINEAPQRLNKKDLNMFGSKWFQPEDASGLRKRMQNLLLEEFESSRLQCGREGSHDRSASSSSEPDEQQELTFQSS
ncbi:ubiquitin-like-specific protease 1D isoform X2 [Phalaenopsis equestris]|uniref:ubiquitin-like-specific protease 1D isoform X2 n=1 Tax=Phalaenopsis equestris TaxID=78828 RepID=UPI0009E39184|nr:ubiquitin-like-specific protease 1D isoform X2 [Phalaenopsis equestris]